MDNVFVYYKNINKENKFQKGWEKINARYYKR